MIKQDLMDIIEPGDHWISVTDGMSGYFAVEMRLNDEEDFGPSVEPYDTGFGRYATYDEAKEEAMQWAAEAGLPFIK